MSSILSFNQRGQRHLPINKLKGKVTMLFITHQIPRGLQVDEVFSFDGQSHTTAVGVVGKEKE